MAKARLGARSTEVKWIAADVTTWEPPQLYEVWHDRAAFHFLVDPKDRAAYAERVLRAVRPGGHVIIGTFALHGPERCKAVFPSFVTMPLRSVRYWAPRSICRRAVPTPIERLWGQSSRSNSPAFGVLFGERRHSLARKRENRELIRPTVFGLNYLICIVLIRGRSDRCKFPTARGRIAGAAGTRALGQVGLHFGFREGGTVAPGLGRLSNSAGSSSSARCGRLWRQHTRRLWHMPPIPHLDGRG